MKALRVTGLRSRLLLGAVLVLLPVLVLMVSVAWLQYASAKRAVRTDAQNLARELANQQERQIDVARRLLEGLLRVPVLREGDPAACSAMLAQIRGEAASPYQNFTVIRPSGELRCSAEPLSGSVDMSQLPGFAETLKRASFHVGGYAFGQRAGRPNLSLLAPALDRHGDVVMLIHAALDLDWLGNTLTEGRLPPGSVVSLIDGRGIVMLSHPDPGNWIGRKLQGTPLADILNVRSETVFEAPGLDGAPHIQAVVPLVWDGEPAAWLHVSIPVGAAYAPLERLLAANLGTFLLLLLLIAAAWLGLDRRVLSPLRELDGVVRQIADGERSLRAMPRRDDEIGSLATGFNRMLDGLVASQRALVESERRWVLALEGAGLGVWDWNAQTGKVFFSRHWKAMFGYSEKDVGNTLKQWSDLIHADDLPVCQADRERHFRGETAVYRNEHRVRAKDGSWRWILDQGMVFERSPNGGPLRVVGTYTDVTERKQAEQSLLEKQSALSEAQRIAHIGSLSWHLASGVITCSDESYRLFGISPDDSIPDRDAFLALVHPDDRAALNAWAEGCIAGRATLDREFRVTQPDGGLRVLNGRGYLQRNAQNKPLAMVGTVQDITERKALEQELDQHRHHLEVLVQSRTAEMETARAEAERLARVKSEFLANMSHEIRTPLNAVLGLAQIGARDSAGRVAHATFTRIREAGEHLLGVINDVLDFSKLEAGRVVVDRQPLALAAVIDNVRSLTSERAASKGLRFGVDLAPDLPEWVAGDAQRLSQILVNLLANAVKFTDRGEARLRVTRNGEDIYFEVSDTGIGMTDEQVACLFRPFEQADNSSTRRYGGTGLGLAISQTLANQMDGEIVVTSTSGAGSTFTLRLPLPETEPALPKPALQVPAASERRLEGLRLLAAEDVEVNRLILEDLLTNEGAQVQFAEHGQQALEHLQEAGVSAFDAVLMDIQMPVMDGYQATEHLRQLAPGLPVIGLTAHALGEERDRCLAAGMVEHVTKPIDADVLVAAILRHAGRPASRATRGPVAGKGGPIDWPALLARYNGRQDFVAKLAATALASHQETPSTLRHAAQANDLPSLAFTAHALKGLSGNLMARSVEALARQVEAAARTKEPQAIEAAVELAGEVEVLLAALTVRVGETAPAPGLSSASAGGR